MTLCGILTATNLAIAIYRHIRIILHNTILTTAIDGAFDECVSADSSLGLGS